MHPRTSSIGLKLAGATALSSALLLAPLAIGLIAPAAAHSEVKSTSPASGATLSTAPTKVVITFNEGIKDVGDGIVVTAPDGARVDSGESVIAGSTATQALKPLVTAGAYTVRYRIVSADGHVVSSQYKFTYRPAATPKAAATASAAADPTATTDPAATPVSADTGGSTSSSAAWPILIGGLVVGIVGASAIAWRRRQGTAG